MVLARNERADAQHAVRFSRGFEPASLAFVEFQRPTFDESFRQTVDAEFFPKSDQIITRLIGDADHAAESRKRPQVFPKFSRAPARMKTEALHRGVMKDGRGVHSSLPNELRQSLSARIPEEIWRQKNIACSAFTQKIDRFAQNHAPKFRRKFFAAQFRQRHR